MAPATTPYESAPMPDNRSLLLELPRELRNHIYDMVLEDEVRLPHCCSAAQSGPVTSTALIRKTSSQIHAEFLERFRISASPIRTKVVNFHLANIIALHMQLKGFSGRPILVELVFSEDGRDEIYAGWDNFAGFLTLLDQTRLPRPVEIEYIARSEAKDQTGPVYRIVDEWYEMEGYRASRVEPIEYCNAEADKIFEALE